VTKVLFSFFIFIFSVSSFAKVVLIDPGHGGEEIGAIGYSDWNKKSGKTAEKDLTLKLASKLKDYLAPHVTAYLTRSFDHLVGLQERADMAEAVKADIFISIHFNSATNHKSHGFELYYLDNNSAVAVKKVERAENLGLKGEELIVNQILVDLVIGQTVESSKSLAKAVHSSIGPVLKQYKLVDRGIKPGLFYVLALSKRPGLLIEGGFMSNPNELSQIKKEKYVDDMARKIAQGVLEYLKTHK